MSKLVATPPSSRRAASSPTRRGPPAVNSTARSLTPRETSASCYARPAAPPTARGYGEVEASAAGRATSGFQFLAPDAKYEPAKLARHEHRIDAVRRHADAILRCLADEPDAPFARHATALPAQRVT